MRPLTVKTKRILAAAGGAAIVLALLLGVDAISGDPLSRAWSRRAAVRYAEKLYPGQSFTVLGGWGGRFFRYVNEVQSAQSADTRFEIETRFWLFTDDTGPGDDVPDHVWRVEQRRNTCLRLEQAADEQLAALAREQYGEAFAPYNESGYRPFVFMLCCDPPYKTQQGTVSCSQNAAAWGGALELDEPFAPAVLQKVPTILTACRICPGGAVTAAEEKQALRELKAFVEGVGWSADYYQVRFLCPSEGSGGFVEFAASDAVPAEDIKAR